MRKFRFSDSQIMEMLKRADAGIEVPALSRKHSYSDHSTG